MLLKLTKDELYELDAILEGHISTLLDFRESSGQTDEINRMLNIAKNIKKQVKNILIGGYNNVF